MKRNIFFTGILLFTLLSFKLFDYNCLNTIDLNHEYQNISLPIDVINNPEMDNMPDSNLTTNAGATLGRVLFYDVDLSKNNTIACASCHKQEFAFTDTARFSIGFDGSVGTRNSMSLMHVRFQRDNNLFWDGRAHSVEEQVLLPFLNPIEMGMTINELVNRISSKSIYPPLFEAAFGSNEINSVKISKALAQFVRSINTFNSKYRKGIEITNGNPEITPFSNFTSEENLGKDLFMDKFRGNCQACHTRNLFVPQGMQNIGLDLVYKDNGAGALNNNSNSSQNGKFKVPSLINIDLTPPYMHDGRFKTLEEVVDFYSDSVKSHPNLSGFLREIVPGNTNPNNNPCMTCPPRRPHFTQVEKKALVAFLKTLTDTTATKDPKWSNPFCKSSVNNNELIPILSYNIYPNPISSEKQIYINLINGKNYKGSLMVTNSLGQKVYTKSFTFDIGKQQIEIPINLKSGIYFISINDGNKTILNKKIIIN